MNRAKLLARLLVQTSVWLGFMAWLLFFAAGNWQWPRAWAFVAILALGSIGFGAWLIRHDPALLASRLGPLTQRGQPAWDKGFLAMFILVWFGWLVLMAFDAQRWHSSDISPLLNVVGGALVVGGFLATMLVFRENSFAAPVVRVQAERKQRLIDTGP